MVFPIKLAAFYPILLEKTFSPAYLFSAVLVVLISLVCFIYWKKHPYLAMAWFYYLVTLAPVLGIVQVGNQAAGDRFTYLPSLAPFLLAAVLFSKLFSRWRPALILFAAAGVGLMGFGTFRQVSMWKDSVTLWENVL